MQVLKMECLNNFCIYEKDNKCMLDTIELDTNGSCMSCIYRNIPPQILEYEKEKLRKRYETDI